MGKPLENIWIKIIALFMGLLLWFHVATEKVYKYRVALPVSEIVLGERLTLADTPPDSMTVMVSASGKQLLRRKWRQQGMKILATQLPAGRHTVSLTTANAVLARAANIVTLAEVVSPTSMLLNIDYKVESQVMVSLNLIAIPDEGFAVSRISEPEPSVVTLLGARSRVRAVKKVSTKYRELIGLRDNLTLILPLVTPEGYDMRLEPDSVTVTVEIIAVKTRVFESIPVVVSHAPADKAVSVQPPTLRLELTGPPEDIDGLSDSALVAWVDYRSLDSSGVGLITIDYPQNFKIKKTSASTAKIIVSN